jgi:hypothetical protein
MRNYDWQSEGVFAMQSESCQIKYNSCHKMSMVSYTRYSLFILYENDYTLSDATCVSQEMIDGVDYALSL